MDNLNPHSKSPERPPKNEISDGRKRILVNAIDIRGRLANKPDYKGLAEISDDKLTAYIDSLAVTDSEIKSELLDYRRAKLASQAIIDSLFPGLPQYVSVDDATMITRGEPEFKKACSLLTGSFYEGTGVTFGCFSVPFGIILLNGGSLAWWKAKKESEAFKKYQTIDPNDHRLRQEVDNHLFSNITQSSLHENIHRIATDTSVDETGTIWGHSGILCFRDYQTGEPGDNYIMLNEIITNFFAGKGMRQSPQHFQMKRYLAEMEILEPHYQIGTQLEAMVGDDILEYAYFSGDSGPLKDGLNTTSNPRRFDKLVDLAHQLPKQKTRQKSTNITDRMLRLLS